MKTKAPKNKVIANDLMRYKRNKLSGNLALLALVFMCIYFMFVYKQVAGNSKTLFENGKPVYTYLNGISVILNLVLLLAIFLSSEELKGYNKKFCYVVWVIAAVQILRIFGYPTSTLTTKLSNGRTIIDAGTYTLFVICLVASAACLVAAGVIGYISSIRLEKFKKDLENGEVDLDAALAEEDAPVAEKVSEAEVTGTEVE